MRWSLSRTLRSSKALPHWILAHIRLLAEVPHFLPLEEIAQPVWRLPAGVRAAAIILSLAGLVGGVRVLDAQIANRASTLPAGPMLAEASSDIVTRDSITTSNLEAGTSPREDAPTALIVDKIPAGDAHRFLGVTVTGYSIDNSATAIGRRARPGTLALSRDLLRDFTPGAPFSLGDRVLIPGMGMYVVEDAMGPRWREKADIWFGDASTARRWGVRNVYITRLTSGEPLIVSSSWNR